MIIKFISVYLFVGVLLLSFMFVNSFVRGNSSYTKAFGVFCLTTQVYLLGYLLEINAGSLEDMFFWNQVQYFGIPFFPALWLIVSILYTGKGKYLKGVGGIVVFIIPVTTFFLRLTNGWHHWYYSAVILQEFRGINFMLLTKGPWYFVQIAYVLTTLFISTWIYYQRYQNSTGDEKMQFRLLLLASGLMYLAMPLVAVNAGGIGIDYTALILPPCILLLYLSLTQYNFLEIKDLARERVFEESGTGLILLNRFYRVVDYNDASIAFFRWFDVSISEEQLKILLADQPELLNCVMESKTQVFHFSVDGEVRYVSIHSRDVQNKKEIVGYLISFEDVTERETLKQRLIEMANTDELTRLNNRRRFTACAEAADLRARRNHENLSVLMMDIDFFKKVNDSYGHHGGDAVLRDFAAMLADTFSGTDIVGRIGGEEFAVVMLNTDAKKAVSKAEVFRKAVAEKMIIHEDQAIRVTVSIGVAELSEATADFDALMNCADRALYKAKNSGRNQTVLLKKT
ncbi:diguanylate cyclase [Acetobacterium wieringae]|uniref:histidine kinase N-terminal 7TM domain-containing diguanylate cyclase n=1 Tax=Acetobacterium wieringae TaxID=52694 RepID=UPI0026EF5095|nr:diguanylate cyclase [Acetobacterium wieringae]